MALTERKKKILQAVVESYIQTAEPVGSKTLQEQLDLDVSSATIRNELADLTELGYLEQPHTSAGRVPSPKGYRLYVNELMEQQRLSMEETRQINEALHLKMQELDKVIDQAGRVVSQLTNYPAFALGGRGAENDHPTVRSHYGGSQFLYHRGDDRYQCGEKQAGPSPLGPFGAPAPVAYHPA